MLLFWWMLILVAKCSDEITLDRAEQSSTLNHIAANAIDNNLHTHSHTQAEATPWLRVYFKSKSTVEKVVVEKGYSYGPTCLWTVSVYDGETETVCGTYTDKPNR